MRLSGIPVTRVSYNTLDEGDFDFDGLCNPRNYERKRKIDTDPTQTPL